MKTYLAKANIGVKGEEYFCMADFSGYFFSGRYWISRPFHYSI